MLRFNDPAFRRRSIGMPDAHAEAFKNVAQSQRCVIVSRATGPTCLQLLEQGYDTKGFRIHAKSCDWGPMAGFVLRDPRLNKGGKGNAGYNAHEHAESLSDAHSGAGWTARATPLKIYNERLLWLQQHNKVTANFKIVGDRMDAEASHPSGIHFHYSLFREGDLWSVWFDNGKNGTRFEQQRDGTPLKYHPKYGKLYEPMLAMTNPVDHRSWKGDDFRNAITGDYDLFAVWPFVRAYDHDGDDRRPLGTARGWGDRQNIVNNLERNFTHGGEGTKIGNITNRIYMVGQMLNSSVGCAHTFRGGTFANRNVIWHSDEAARPFVNDVDLPLIAFSPSRLEIGIETIVDFRKFVDHCQRSKIKVTLGDGWVLNPEPGKANRLGSDYAHLVPTWMGGQKKVPGWYNS